MPNPHALVSAVSNVRPPDDGPAPDSAFLVGTTPLPGGDYWIDFANAEYAPARLPCNHPRFDAYLEMISDLTTGSRPMYFEVSDAAAAKRAITRAAPVRICRVRSVGPIDAFVIVRLSASHTDHVLRSTSPDFEALYRQLKDAEGKADAFVCISESSRSKEIFFVQPAPEGLHPFGGLARSPEPERILTEAELIERLAPVDEDRAPLAFRAMAAMSCEPEIRAGNKPLLRPRGCTPFTLPDDGCHARAHHMCERLRRDHAIDAAKVWLHGEGSFARPMRATLRPESTNHPRGVVIWSYHVAPAIRVRVGTRAEWRVIDPSLFTAADGLPTPAEWKRRQNDPRAQLSFSQAAVFDQVEQGVVEKGHYDPDFVLVPAELDFYRTWLRDRVDACGAPPYR